jgi:DNA-3-methyladenine glycosylase
MMRNSGPRAERDLLNGPGKLCRSFGLTRDHNGLDLTGGVLFVEDRGDAAVDMAVSPRVGIKEGTELAWRYFDANSDGVSGNRRRLAAARELKHD